MEKDKSKVSEEIFNEIESIRKISSENDALKVFVEKVWEGHFSVTTLEHIINGGMPFISQPLALSTVKTYLSQKQNEKEEKLISKQINITRYSAIIAGVSAIVSVVTCIISVAK